MGTTGFSTWQVELAAAPPSMRTKAVQTLTAVPGEDPLPHHHAELGCPDGLVEGQHELPLCLLALVALSHPQQAAYNICVQSQSVVSSFWVAGLQAVSISDFCLKQHGLPP